VLHIASESRRILVFHDGKDDTHHFVWFRKTRSSPRLIIVSQDLDIGAAIVHLILIWLIPLGTLRDWEQGRA
jgi:hypothetical protein